MMFWHRDGRHLLSIFTAIRILLLWQSYGNNRYRHSIFLERAFVEDSSFPSKAGESLIAKIKDDRLVFSKKTN
jgi:hypothetical protein